MNVPIYLVSEGLIKKTHFLYKKYFLKKRFLNKNNLGQNFDFQKSEKSNKELIRVKVEQKN